MHTVRSDPLLIGGDGEQAVLLTACTHDPLLIGGDGEQGVLLTACTHDPQLIGGMVSRQSCSLRAHVIHCSSLGMVPLSSPAWFLFNTYISFVSYFSIGNLY